MKVAITGATGFVGSRLVEKLTAEGDRVVALTRDPARAQRLFPASTFPDIAIVAYQPTESGPWQGVIAGCEGVVNLAGEPIAERWSAAHKRQILTSRQVGTEKLVEAIAQARPQPDVLVNASAIGYYGTSETATFDEASPPGDDFLAQVCQRWETEASKVQKAGVRLAILRIGIVLGAGGALAKMIMPFKLFAGGPIGSGRQWFSWIHRDDLVSLIITALKQPKYQGTFNATAPHPVTMNQLCKTLGDVMGRPSWLPVPPIALEVLLGDGAKVVLEGQQVLPHKTQAVGFQYQYPSIEAALRDVVPQL